ncbi:Uncharacterised protein [Mycobacteroides abscessus subsp. massiliense]|nr:Uncharacterised protein [Mycobacteroides abscessus subsp. massiliense]
MSAGDHRLCSQRGFGIHANPPRHSQIDSEVAAGLELCFRCLDCERSGARPTPVDWPLNASFQRQHVRGEGRHSGDEVTVGIHLRVSTREVQGLWRN